MDECDPPMARLVPAGDAIAALAGQYKRDHDYKEMSEMAWRALQDKAHDTLISRLENGLIASYADRCVYEASGEDGHYIKHKALCYGSIPVEFWILYSSLKKSRTYDVHTHDFSFSFRMIHNDHREGSAHCVVFDVKDLPPAAIPPLAGGVPKMRGGRRPADGWADFCEELAVYIHDNGIPAGGGATGQDEMFNKVSNRLAEQGKTGPSRTTMQPVIRRVLMRIRGNQ